jgi:hypothetical protein
MNRKNLLLVVGIALCLPLVVFIGMRIYSEIRFDINCGEHMELASHASTTELALQEMEIVIAYAEREQATSGYTSVLWKTPNDDVGYWYQNLKSARDELRAVKSDTTQEARSQILLKLREVLTSKKGSEGKMEIKVPDGIQRYPNNALYYWGTWASVLLCVVGALMIVVWANQKNSGRIPA